jgi:hypothetical protein
MQNLQLQPTYWTLPITAAFPNRDTAYLNPKPREDSHVVDRFNGIVIVADGVTRTASNKQYPVPSPAAMASQEFVAEAHKALCSVIDKLEPMEALKFAARAGNLAVRKVNAELFDTIDYNVNDLAGACAVLTLVRDGKLYYLSNGDCSGYIEKSPGELERFTENQTEKIRDWRKTAPKEEQSKIFSRQHVRNNPSHPAAYGVFTGEESALDSKLLSSGCIDLSSVQRVVLASDGTEELFKRKVAVDLGLPKTVLKAAEALDAAMASRSDDKTLVTLEVFKIG